MGKSILNPCPSCQGQSLTVKKGHGGWSFTCNGCNHEGPPPAMPRSRAEREWNEQAKTAPTPEASENDSPHAAIAAPLVAAVRSYLRTCEAGGLPHDKAVTVLAHVVQAADFGYFTEALGVIHKNLTRSILAEFDWKNVEGTAGEHDPSWPTESGEYQVRLFTEGETGEYGHVYSRDATWEEIVEIEVIKEEGQIRIEMHGTLSGDYEWDNTTAWRKLPGEKYTPMTDYDAAPATQAGLLDWP